MITADKEIIALLTEIAGGGGGGGGGITGGTAGNVIIASGATTIQDSGISLISLAPLDSPHFTGVPAAPTASGGTSTTQIATTGFVATGYVPIGGALGTPSSGTVTNLTGTASININGTVGAILATTGAFTTLTNTGAATNSKSGAASTPALTVSGVPFAGTGTTSFPLVYINDANATASTTLSTAGTYLGVNGDGTADLANLMKDGVNVLKVDPVGAFSVTAPTASVVTLNSGSGSTGIRMYGTGGGRIGGTGGFSGAIGFYRNDGSYPVGLDIGKVAFLSGNDLEMDLGSSGFRWKRLYVGPVIGTPGTLSGAGAVDVTTLSTAYTSTGAAQALTLADGVAGQIKTIAHVSDGGSGVLTPTTKSGYSTITFTNVGDAVTLQFFTTAGWIIVGQNGVTVAP